MPPGTEVERSFVVSVADLEEQQYDVYRCGACSGRYLALHPDGALEAVQTSAHERP